MSKAQNGSPDLEAHRSRVHLHCYRMTGSLHDAEDLTQEILVRAWERFPSFREESSLTTWLYRIATNACLDFLRGKKRRSLAWDGVFPQYRTGEPLPPALPEALWLEPYPDPEDQALRKERVSLAFLTLLHTLPPRQRAAVLLADVLGYAAKETAALLDLTPAAVNSALQRARKTLGPGALAEVEEDEVKTQMLERFLRAWEAGDAQAIADLMRDDVRMVMPPIPLWVLGRSGVLQVLLDYPMRRGADRWKLVPAPRANGHPAFGFYLKDDDGVFRGWGLQVLSIDPWYESPSPIREYYVFKGPHLLRLFGLPDPLP